MDTAFNSYISEIHMPTAGSTIAGQDRLDSLSKPHGSLGRLEEIALTLWRIQGKRPISVDPALIFTVAADHGVTEEGISRYSSCVTRQMLENFLNGGAGINVLCKTLGIEQMIVDAGCLGEELAPHPQLINMRVGNGTNNFTKGPAMSISQAWSCVNNGISLAKNAANKKVRCIGLGEMGIGNTTTASALVAAYMNLKPEDITGAGAGLPPLGLGHKIRIVNKALKANQEAVESRDPMLILSALGGFEIATLVGIILGAAHENIAVIVDGFISTSAYIAAWKICPEVSDYCIFSHTSQEYGHSLVLSCINRKPLLDLELRLGEGSGSALGISLLRSAAAIFNDMATFESAKVNDHKARND